jgi:4-hydroxybenzoate polyprenyltransferase
MQLTGTRFFRSFDPYIQIARIDHWFKNVFMLLGVLVAFFFYPALVTWESLPTIGWALLATCLIASSNYVINELIDAPWDRLHPKKRFRPVPQGLVLPWLAILEWLILAAIGLAMAYSISVYFALTALTFWIMGIVYNIPPIRSKDLPYLDVLTESFNNPLRLFLGWFAVTSDTFPPLSLIISYWMAGAFLMTVKRFAEYRFINNPATAAKYRTSFRHYNEEKLLVSILFYTAMCALFGGIFIVRYRVELILFVPVIAGLFAYYLKLGLKENSPTQNPESLYRERGFLLYTVLSGVIFTILMTKHIPWLYIVFNINDAELWQTPIRFFHQ